MQKHTTVLKIILGRHATVVGCCSRPIFLFFSCNFWTPDLRSLLSGHQLLNLKNSKIRTFHLSAVNFTGSQKLQDFSTIFDTRRLCFELQQVVEKI